MARFASIDRERSAALMRAMDAANRRFGRNTLRPGIVMEEPRWGMRRGNISPSYTTRADQMLKARA